MLTQADALRELQDLVSPTVCPALSDSDLLRILERTRRASVWVAQTAYAAGDKMVPVLSNGRLYRCLQGGTTGAVPPVWSRYGTAFYGGYSGARVSDGSVVWEDAGPAHREVYDVRAAAKAAWMKKSAIASQEHDFALAGGDNYKREQVYAHCVAMAARYGRVGIS